jgi:hypothetical protein
MNGKSFSFHSHELFTGYMFDTRMEKDLKLINKYVNAGSISKLISKRTKKSKEKKVHMDSLNETIYVSDV